MTKLAYAAGLGIGLLWIALAIVTLRSAAQGFIYDRPDWGVGWGLVGILLLAAGAIAVIGTWWHLNRVKGRHHA
ncbi:MAG TPA: hypothetical protein VF212_10620 [Longimicrobiales bacterium]